MTTPERAQRLAELLGATSPQARARAEMTGVLPVLPELTRLLPDGGLPMGVVSEVADPSLLLAVTAGVAVTRPDVYTAVVGMPEIGLSAWARYGQDVRRVALVDIPGEHWAEVVSTLIGGFEVVIAAPPQGGIPPTVTKRLGARLRQHRCALVSPSRWPGSALRLEVAHSGGWLGLGDGWGQIRGRQVTVRVSGRGVWQARTAELMLPDEHGRVSTLDAEQAVLPSPELADLYDFAGAAY